MLGYLLRRVLAAIPVMGVVALFVFLLLRLTPGDPAAILAGDNASPEQLERIRASLGLNEPLYQQFFTWLNKLLHGDLGESLISHVPVLKMISQRVEPSISIALSTIVLSILVAVPLGVVAAWKHGTWIDRFVMGLSVVGFSVPVFVIGYVLIQIFAIDLRWVPVQGFRSITAGFGPFLERIILPTCALSFIYVALIARMTRASMLDVLGEDYVRTARAKGIGETAVLLRHALRNAAVPVITVIGTGFALLISGVVVTESVFNLPGIGRLTVDAVLARDYPVIQAMILLTSLIYVTVNLLIDVAYGRDVLSRILYGGRISLLIGLGAAVFSICIGLVIGLVSGFFKWVDAVLMRVMDGLMAIPSILLAIAVVSLSGASLTTVLVAITIPEIPRVARLVRSVVLSAREEPYVEAAISVGSSLPKIMWRHLMPNTVAPLIVQGTYVCASAILTEAILSFLGAGISPETPTWGNIMAEGRAYFQVKPSLIFWPGLLLSIAILSVNLIGDAARDALDPRMKQREAGK